MSKLDELIKELCPNGVEYKELGEICITVTSPLKLKKSDYKIEGKIPIIDQGEEYIAGYIDFNEYLPKEEYILFGDHSEIIKYVNFEFIQGADGLKILRTKNQIKVKYIYYCFNNFYKKENGYKRHWSNAKRTLIPIPPLEVQDEIVKILDDYTKSVEELKEKLNEELIARKKQYSWYRDYLLKFENKVKMVKIGDLFEFKNGINKDKSSFGKGTPIINYVNVYKKNKIYFEDLKGLVEASNDELVRYGVKRGDVFFTRTSETIEEIGYTSVLLEDIENCVFSGFLLRARPITDLLLPEYCAYCFSTSNIRNAIIKKSTYTTRALTNGTSLSQIEIPLPPLEVQKRIVEVLDNFEKICNDLNIGLPAEIEARQKQYEFYRNFLLTFKIENCTLPKTRQDKTRQDKT